MGQVGWCPMHLSIHWLKFVSCRAWPVRERSSSMRQACSVTNRDICSPVPRAAGKSTIADFFAEREALILSDERIIIRNIADRFMIHGTPWVGSGNYATNDRSPLT